MESSSRSPAKATRSETISCGPPVSSWAPMPEDAPGLVERRRRYIQRQIELNRGDVNVRFRGKPPQGTGSANRHGMPRLPVGQHEVRNWPVLDLGDLPDIDMSAWRL